MVYPPKELIIVIISIYTELVVVAFDAEYSQLKKSVPLELTSGDGGILHFIFILITPLSVTAQIR